MKNYNQRSPDAYRKPIYLKKISIIFFSVMWMSLFWCEKSNGQSTVPPVDSYLTFENGEGVAFVSISDSTTISEIEIQVGSKGVADAVFSHTYSFDQTTGLPQGLTYLRIGLQLYLGIGAIIPPAAFDVKVRLKDHSGNWSNWLEYISN